MEHAEAAQICALIGAVGAALALLARGRALPFTGLVLLGLAAAGLLRSLVSDDDLRLLFTTPEGIALVGAGCAAVAVAAIPLARYPTVVPVALLATAPFRIPIELGSEEAFLLFPLYFVIAASALALGYRMLRGERPSPPPFLLALPLSVFVGCAAASFLWTWDDRSGGIALAFFVFPFTAGLATVARAPYAQWLPRALLVTLVALGSVFAAIGIWQAQTRTLFFARDVAVANAYTTFFRVTSLFKDPSLYGRYLVIPIVVALVAVLFRRGRWVELAILAALMGLLFWGLFFSYSQSSFVALFVVTFAVALVAAGRRLRIALAVCALLAALAAGAFAAQAVEGRSARDVTSGRSRLVSVTLDAFQARPVTGVGIGGQPRASTEESGRGSPARNASHTTPLTILAELGIVGFALFVWLLAAAAWTLALVVRHERSLGVGLAAVFGVLAVHSLLYAGFFEDPLTWGVLGVASAALAASAATARVGLAGGDVPQGAPGLRARWRRGPVRLAPPVLSRRLAWILAGVAVLVVVLAGATLAFFVLKPDPTRGALDTELEGVTVSEADPTPPPVPEPGPEPEPTADRRCWNEFGGDPLRSLARPGARLGLPVRKALWTRGLGSYIEFAPVYCDGMLYVNTFGGTTWAIEAETGKVRWRARVGGTLPSSPAIDGPRIIVSSQAGTVTALDRETGRPVWTVRTAGKVESSPVVVEGLVYFGSHDGRLFAASAKTGSIRWAYDTGGRINASPSVFRDRVCATTYAGSFVCLNRRTGAAIWVTYIKRDSFRYESFYASPSSDGERLYSVARSGKVVALDASTGEIVWTGRVGGLGYTTPAVGRDRVFVGGFDGRIRALRAGTGDELWNTWVGGRILGAPVLIGEHVFFSTLERRTYAVRASDGEVVWRLPLGRYTPGIATERTYYFSLNGRLIAYRGRNAAPD